MGDEDLLLGLDIGGTQVRPRRGKQGPTAVFPRSSYLCYGYKDCKSSGMGNAGYVIPDEFQEDLRHEGAGRLSMANRGPGTGSAQFFITLNPTPHLDGKHTVFGHCNEAAIRLADDIALVPRDANDKPRDVELLNSVEIVRRPRGR